MVRVALESDEPFERRAERFEDAAVGFREGFAFVERVAQVEGREIVDDRLVQSSSVVSLLNGLAMAGVSNDSREDLFRVVPHHLASHPDGKSARELLPSGFVAISQRVGEGVADKRERPTVRPDRSGDRVARVAIRELTELLELLEQEAQRLVRGGSKPAWLTCCVDLADKLRRSCRVQGHRRRAYHDGPGERLPQVAALPGSTVSQVFLM